MASRPILFTTGWYRILPWMNWEALGVCWRNAVRAAGFTNPPSSPARQDSLAGSAIFHTVLMTNLRSWHRAGAKCKEESWLCSPGLCPRPPTHSSCREGMVPVYRLCPRRGCKDCGKK